MDLTILFFGILFLMKTKIYSLHYNCKLLKGNLWTHKHLLCLNVSKANTIFVGLWNQLDRCPNVVKKYGVVSEETSSLYDLAGERKTSVTLCLQIFTFLEDRRSDSDVSASNVFWSSWISRKSDALIVRYNQKKEYGFSLFCGVLRTHQLLITLKLLVWFSWGFQQNVPLQSEKMSTSIK